MLSFFVGGGPLFYSLEFMDFSQNKLGDVSGTIPLRK